ncbi:uncharacterized protein VDAG_10520 [Verticillium dahliae VdLs.17]|uniref:Uncharacterized protein n=1 Tax=Verticillium dahliae (strain VdLs.17 / ATCC MYA-4575 / FGSC 10137) TaxID=498257 RepID=G2XK38_VERDV|nr:uncharacterized protein VDAG_10520 [Verticillium dahliae VdLs.17]EGY21538.1 hypothetical protein VDAG_10520 [Verticillium dahliae VdLs.17]KAH6692069.1 hypothetical protein EV126DRAFT_445111 [Verticillium dahliae]
MRGGETSWFTSQEPGTETRPWHRGWTMPRTRHSQKFCVVTRIQWGTPDYGFSDSTQVVITAGTITGELTRTAAT